nr:hypothetical protein GCM10020063_013270 [Dactylosporangium thailandense]
MTKVHAEARRFAARGDTVGASAPPRLVEEVIDALRARGPVAVHERRTASEFLRFALPPSVRP